MYYILATFIFLLYLHDARCGEEAEHRDFQYNSIVDPQTGRYNFAYDTGHDNQIAHALHMQYRDANGVVRGRYGYTDPRGKLRMVEYEAGPDGFVARGDVGPDQFPHDQTPQTQVSQTSRFTQNDDLNLVPRPVQMAGWDPAADPMGQSPPVPSADQNSGDGTGSNDAGLFLTTNVTSGAELEISPGVLPYDERYPRIYMNANDNTGRESEDLSTDKNEEGTAEEQYPVAGPLTLNTIDVNLDDIRSTSDNQGSSAEGVNSRSSRALPYSYRNYRGPTHDHDSEVRTQATGYRVVYRPNHEHYNENYYRRPTHDHDAEKRYVSSRQTHDHDAERRYYISNRNRQTHDHDAERRYYYNRNRQTHDHDAERPFRYRDGYYWNGRYYSYYPTRRRVFYRDSHSMVPHEHYSDIYRNDNDRYHQHSDRHLYGRSQNLAVPATARPRQLAYVPSDKYHDKYYYWDNN